jgi:hypothetical protein
MESEIISLVQMEYYYLHNTNLLLYNLSSINKSKLLAIAIKHRDNNLINELFTLINLEELVLVCYILDARRKRKQLLKKKQKIKNKYLGIQNILFSDKIYNDKLNEIHWELEDIEHIMDNYYDFSLNSSQTKKIKKFISSYYKDKNPYLYCKNINHWYYLYDVLHLSNNDISPEFTKLLFNS